MQSKLKMAYIQRERGEQLVEKEGLKALERQTQLQVDAAMERARLAAIEAEKVVREKERLKGEERKRVLEAQLEERQVREFISAEQEAKREKGLVDAILAKIKAEDEAEAANKARARAEVLRAIEDFKGQRERAVAAALAAEREESARIAAFLAEQGKREEAHKAGKAEDAAAREAQYRLLVAAEEERRRKQEEEDMLRWVLVDDEADRRRAAEEAKKKEREERIRVEMRAANEQQRMCVGCAGRRGGVFYVCPAPCVACFCVCARSLFSFSPFSLSISPPTPTGFARKLQQRSAQRRKSLLRSF